MNNIECLKMVYILFICENQKLYNETLLATKSSASLSYNSRTKGDTKIVSKKS